MNKDRPHAHRFSRQPIGGQTRWKHSRSSMPAEAEQEAVHFHVQAGCMQSHLLAASKFQAHTRLEFQSGGPHAARLSESRGSGCTNSGAACRTILRQKRKACALRFCNDLVLTLCFEPACTASDAWAICHVGVGWSSAGRQRPLQGLAGSWLHRGPGLACPSTHMHKKDHSAAPALAGAWPRHWPQLEQWAIGKPGREKLQLKSEGTWGGGWQPATPAMQAFAQWERNALFSKVVKGLCTSAPTATRSGAPNAVGFACCQWLRCCALAVAMLARCEVLREILQQGGRMAL